MDGLIYFISLIKGEINFDILYFIAQIFGIALIVFSVLAFQQKTQKKILIFHCICSIFGFLHLTILSKYNGQFMGAVLYVFAVFRAIVFFFGNKWGILKGDLWVYLLSSLYLISYACLFIVFKKEFNINNALIEILPVIGSIIMTFGFYCKKAKFVRLIYLIGTPFWLTYGVLIGAIGTTVSEGLNVVSILIGILRLDIKNCNKRDLDYDK